MAKTPQYTNEADLRPTEVGIEATAAAARRSGAFFNQTAQDLKQLGSETAQAGEQTARMASSAIRGAGKVAVDYMEHREKQQGALADAQLTDQLTNDWNERVKNADPNDPTVAAKFRQEVLEPQLQKYGEGFLTEGGQKFAEARVERLRDHMFHKTSADMATLAAAAVTTNIHGIANERSNTAVQDPSSVPHLLNTIDADVAAIVDSSPNLKGAAATKARIELTEKMREQIVKAGALSAIQKSANPEAEASKWTAKYPDYVNGAEALQFAKAAAVQAKTNLLAQKQLETYAKQQDQLAAHARANKVMSDNVSIDPQTNRPIIKPDYFRQSLEIAKMPNAPDGLARTLLDWGEHQQNLRDAATRDDPEIKQSLYTGLFSAEKPTTEVDILKAEIAKQISPQTGTMMRALSKELAEHPLKGPVWQDTMAAVKNELIVSIPGLPGKDNTGLNNYASFAQTFIPQYLAKARAGTLEPNALDVKDPNSMISKAMAPFKRTQSQRMQDYIAAVGGVVPGSVVPGRKVGDVPVPAALGGIAALQYNKAKGLWRDQTSGKIYDSAGAEVRQ